MPFDPDPPSPLPVVPLAGSDGWLMQWARWPLAVQLLVFWLAVAGGAGGWALSLWLLAGRPVAVPAPLQAAYVCGLYAWLLWLCHRCRRVLALPALPLARPAGLLTGAALALACLGLLAAVSLGLGWAQLRPLRSDWPLILGQVLLMAVAVAAIEEIVFRGLMLDLVLRRHGPGLACQLQAGIYACLHLLRSDLDLFAWLLALASLWLTGLLLGQLRLHSQGLAVCFGLHGAWICQTRFAAWSGLLSWDPAWARWSGLGNPVYGLSGMAVAALGCWLARPAAEAKPAEGPEDRPV